MDSKTGNKNINRIKPFHDTLCTVSATSSETIGNSKMTITGSGCYITIDTGVRFDFIGSMSNKQVEAQK